jgi:hypothetical protein
MGQSQINKLKRRIQALERSLVLKPPPDPPDWLDVVRMLAYVSLPPPYHERLLPVESDQHDGILRVLSRSETEASDAGMAALKLEIRRAAFSEFAEYKRAYDEICREVPITDKKVFFNPFNQPVIDRIYEKIYNFRRSHSAPKVPDDWEIPEGSPLFEAWQQVQEHRWRW